MHLEKCRTVTLSHAKTHHTDNTTQLLDFRTETVPGAFPSLNRMSTHHLTIYLSVVVNNVSHSVSSLPVSPRIKIHLHQTHQNYPTWIRNLSTNLRMLLSPQQNTCRRGLVPFEMQWLFRVQAPGLVDLLDDANDEDLLELQGLNQRHALMPLPLTGSAHL